MRNQPSNRVSRRLFTRTALTGGSAAALAAGAGQKTITQASVPEDPDAPRPQDGTVNETEPFAAPLKYQRLDVPAKVIPFPMGAVRLLPGPFADAQEANRQLLHRLPVDRLVHTFRLNAKLASNAEPLGGWEKPDCELRGHFVGHFLSACALMYASADDAELKEKGDALVSQLAECQQHLSGGYLSAFPLELFDRLDQRKKVWAPFYTIHKIMAGLFDMYRYCDNRQALTVLKGMADWADHWTSNMTEAHLQIVLDTEYGGMNEVLYNLAAATDEPRYAQVGDRFTKKRFFNPLALRRDQLRGLHTNTHIPQVIGAARRYEISGDQRFHDVADYFWQEVVDTRTYVTGGTSNNEGWLVEPNHLAQELSLGSDTNECCCAYNMLKLTRMLYTWTADPRYFDYYERILYNHRLGTIDLQQGMTQYYLGVVPGSWRTFGTEFNSFWCCNGTGAEEYSKLNDSIYFQRGDHLYVNLFIPSQLTWKGARVKVTQTTTFPRDPSASFVIAPAEPKRFALHLRIPIWVAGFPVVKINGTATDVSAAPGGYVTLLRTWQSGDRVELALPMHLYTESMADDHTLQAILYGPLVLAGALEQAPVAENLISNKMGPSFKEEPAPPHPTFSAAGKALTDWVQPAGSPLTFIASDGRRKVELAPFSQVSAGRRYSLYWKVV